jgi:hypothetical protein
MLIKLFLAVFLLIVLLIIRAWPSEVFHGGGHLRTVFIVPPLGKDRLKIMLSQNLFEQLAMD